MRNVKLSITLLSVICYLLFVTGCQDIMSPPAVPKHNGETGLLITVANGEANARTLYPGSAFTKYVLKFEALNGTDSHADVPLTGTASITVNDLAAGD
jgi:hypothetical protein